jgi:hypothetical protein
MDDIAVPKELLSQLLEALAEAKHLDRRGSPSPRMTYVLTIKQESISEDFVSGQRFMKSLSKASSCSTARIHFVELPSAAAPADGGKLKA